MMLALAGTGGCEGRQKDWMKVDQSYTTAEFRHDIAACTKDGKLDEACMRARGWVDVTPSQTETPKAPENFRARPTGAGSSTGR